MYLPPRPGCYCGVSDVGMQGGLMQLQPCRLEDYVTWAYSDNGLVPVSMFCVRPLISLSLKGSLCWQFFPHGRVIAMAPSSNKTEAPTYPFA
jgi:hypothetical protein